MFKKSDAGTDVEVMKTVPWTLYCGNSVEYKDSQVASQSPSVLSVSIKAESVDSQDEKELSGPRNMATDPYSNLERIERDEVEDAAVPMETDEEWNVNVGFEVELACLEDVEVLEDKIYNASLQVNVSSCPSVPLSVRFTIPCRSISSFFGSSFHVWKLTFDGH